MKSKLLLTIAFAITLLSVVFAIMTISYNSELEITISRKDEIIKNALQKDSLINSSTKQYADKISQYVDNCNFNIDGRDISSEEFIEIFNETSYRYQRTKDSLNAYMKALDSSRKSNEEMTKNAISYLQDYKKALDSIVIYKSVLKYYRREYGLYYTVRTEGKDRTIQYPLTKADSAMMVYKYYKHKLSSDKPGSFTIDVEDTGVDRKKNLRKN